MPAAVRAWPCAGDLTRHSPRVRSPVAHPARFARTAATRTSLSADPPPQRLPSGVSRRRHVGLSGDGPVDERGASPRDLAMVRRCIRSPPSTCAAASPDGPSWPDGREPATLLALVSDGEVAHPARGVFCRPALVGTLAAGDLRLRQLTCAAGAAALGPRHRRAATRCTCGRRPNYARSPGARRTGGVWPGEGGWPAIFAVLHDCALCLPGRGGGRDGLALRAAAGRRSTTGRSCGAAPGGRRVAQVLALADPEAQSVLESVARVTARPGRGDGRGSSCTSTTSAGSTWSWTAGWCRAGRWEFHGTKFREDRRRDAELSRQGYVVVRFTYADLMSRRAWFVELVREVLDRGRPPFGGVGVSPASVRATRRERVA